MPDVVCLGELLIDLVAAETNRPLAGVTAFRRAPGGPPPTWPAASRRLGRTAGFIGKVGDDPFGVYLRQTLKNEGVDTRGLVSTPQARTTLAFIGVHDDGRKEVIFWRNPGADMLLTAEDIDESYVGGAACFHFGSISLIDEGPRQATLKAARAARAPGDWSRLIPTGDPPCGPLRTEDTWQSGQP